MGFTQCYIISVIKHLVKNAGGLSDGDKQRLEFKKGNVMTSPRWEQVFKESCFSGDMHDTKLKIWKNRRTEIINGFCPPGPRYMKRKVIYKELVLVDQAISLVVDDSTKISESSAECLKSIDEALWTIANADIFG